MIKFILLLLGTVFFTAFPAAARNPLQLSLTPDIALLDRDEEVRGVSLGLWGENPQSALALGIIQGSTGESRGLSWACLNYAQNYTGVQWAFINFNMAGFTGWQGGTVNYTGGEMRGLQTGALNFADRLRGIQFGLINYAEMVEKGLQIGLINAIPRNEWFTGLPDELAPAMLFLNWRL